MYDLHNDSYNPDVKSPDAETGERQGLLDDHEGQDIDSRPAVYHVLRRKGGKCRGRHPLRCAFKNILKVGWVGLLIWGAVRLYARESLSHYESFGFLNSVTNLLFKLQLEPLSLLPHATLLIPSTRQLFARHPSVSTRHPKSSTTWTRTMQRLTLALTSISMYAVDGGNSMTCVLTKDPSSLEQSWRKMARHAFAIS